MKIRHSTAGGDEKIELQMTPMIDIVFQLLIFFIMTFKIVAQEGDFNIKMPLAAPSEGLPDEPQLPPLKLRMQAGASGGLARMVLNEREFGTDFNSLHSYIISFVGNDSGPGSIQESAEVELDCDYNLKYDEVIKAITAISGYVADDGQIVKLIEKIKFTPPKKEPGSG
jgi:biopolymer transport protein ExbD